MLIGELKEVDWEGKQLAKRYDDNHGKLEGDENWQHCDEADLDESNHFGDGRYPAYMSMYCASCSVTELK